MNFFFICSLAHKIIFLPRFVGGAQKHIWDRAMYVTQNVAHLARSYEFKCFLKRKLFHFLVNKNHKRPFQVVKMFSYSLKILLCTCQLYDAHIGVIWLCVSHFSMITFICCFVIESILFIVNNFFILFESGKQSIYLFYSMQSVQWKGNAIWRNARTCEIIPKPTKASSSYSVSINAFQMCNTWEIT